MVVSRAVCRLRLFSHLSTVRSSTDLHTYIREEFAVRLARLTRESWLGCVLPRRSISIFDGKKGELVWDSGDFIEKFTADPVNGFSDIFNSEGGENQAPSSYYLLFFPRPLPLLVNTPRIYQYFTTRIQKILSSKYSYLAFSCAGAQHEQREGFGSAPLVCPHVPPALGSRSTSS